MKYRLAMLLGICLAWPAQQAAADDPRASNPLGTDDSPIYCREGLERILPGDYYGCRGLYQIKRAHYGRAIEMFEEAAYWANKEAQHQLGLAYINGDLPGVAADPARGLAWLALARERHQAQYEHDYALAIAHTTPAQQRAASAIYLQLRARYGDAVAGKRATDRFNREMKAIDDAANQGGEVTLAGYGPFPMQAYTVSRQLHAQAEDDFAGLQGSVLIGPLQRVQDRVDTATLKPHDTAQPATAPASSSPSH